MGLIGSGSAASSATPSTTATTPSAGATTTTPSTGSAISGAQADYARCISGAGEDLAKVQGCAKYLK
jgi:hypothetical protein